MSRELLYTSAPTGLNPNEQGFCTVACTEGTPRNLKEFLESLSGYRQAPAPPHPVCYSHLIHQIGGVRYRILSRVSDYEKDYSGRTNKLAHHVAMAPEDVPEAHPAAVLEAEVCQSSWDGHTRWIAHPPRIPNPPQPEVSCHTWQSITGDAGWSGVLAETATAPSDRPMYIIFSPGDDALALVSEAMSLLPPERTWNTSFCTYFVKLPAGVECRWRFILDGTPEAKALRKSQKPGVLDLPLIQRTGQTAPDKSPMVQIARGGQTSEPTSSPQPDNVDVTFESETYALATPDAEESSPQEIAINPFAVKDTKRPDPFARQKQERSIWPWVLGGTACLLLAGVVFLVYSIATRQPRALADVTDPERAEEVPFKNPEPSAKEAVATEVKTPEPPVQAQHVEPKNLIPFKMGSDPLPQPKPENPLTKLRTTLNGELPLPPRAQDVTAVNSGKSQVLTDLKLPAPEELKLRLYTVHDIAKDAAPTLTLEEITPSETEGRQWAVKRSRLHPLTEDLEFSRVGTFTHAGDELSFAWNMQTPRWTNPLGLQYAVLELQYDDERLPMRLSKPALVKPLQFDFTKETKTYPLEWGSNSLADLDGLKLDLELHGLTARPIIKSGLEPNEHVSIPLRQNPADRNSGFAMELEGRFTSGSGVKPALSLTAYLRREAFLTPGQETPREMERPAQIVNLALAVPTGTIKTPFSLSDLGALSARMQALDRAFAESPLLTVSSQELSKVFKDLETFPKSEALRTKQRNLSAIVSKIGQHQVLARDIVTAVASTQPRLKQLGKEMQIHYELYVMIDGARFPIARSPLISETKPESRTRFRRGNRP